MKFTPLIVTVVSFLTAVILKVGMPTMGPLVPPEVLDEEDELEELVLVWGTLIGLVKLVNAKKLLVVLSKRTISVEAFLIESGIGNV